MTESEFLTILHDIHDSLLVDDRTKTLMIVESALSDIECKPNSRQWEVYGG